jgi:glutathione S-transferase
VKAVRAKVMDAFIGPNLELHMDYLESELARAPWFCGDDMTAADIQMSFPVELMVARAGLDDRRPKLMDWLRRIHARPAYLRALERGGKYDYAKA